MQSVRSVANRLLARRVVEHVALKNRRRRTHSLTHTHAVAVDMTQAAAGGPRAANIHSLSTPANIELITVLYRTSRVTVGYGSQVMVVRLW